MGPQSYMWSVVDRNVFMRRMTVLLWKFLDSTRSSFGCGRSEARENLRVWRR